MLCPPSSACGCAFQSSTLNITVDANGTWHIEQAEFTSITALQADVDALKAWRTTATAQISALETSSTAHGAAITRFDAIQVGGVLQSGSGVGPTIGSADLVVASTTVGPFGVAGNLIWGGHVDFYKTIAGDTFSVRARYAGVIIARSHDASVLGSGGASVATQKVIGATEAPVIDIALRRISGTGTANTQATTTDGGLYWAFIPN